MDQYEVYEPSGEAYGRDTNMIIRSIMRATERPINVKQLFDQFYHAIDLADINLAEELLQQLKKKLGNDDVEISGCNIKLKLLKARVKR